MFSFKAMKSRINPAPMMEINYSNYPIPEEKIARI
jgi:hypothetical protein